MSKHQGAPVSAIIPCFNNEDTLARAVESVAVQTWVPRELIVVDDGSQDGSRDTIMELESHYGSDWLRVIRLDTNRGPGAARNAAWDVATQPFVAFLDADDAWLPRKVAVQTSFMLNNPTVALSGHSNGAQLSPVDGDERSLNGGCVQAKRIEFSALLWRNKIATSTVMLRRTIGQRFIPEKRRSEDYELWLRILQTGGQAAYLKTTLATTFKRRVTDNGLSSDLWGMQRAQWDTYLRIWRTGGTSTARLSAIMVFSGMRFVRRWLLGQISKRRPGGNHKRS